MENSKKTTKTIEKVIEIIKKDTVFIEICPFCNGNMLKGNKFCCLRCYRLAEETEVKKDE